MSRYVWRGSDIGQSPSIQPCIEINRGKFTIGVWGAYSVVPADMQEIDFYLVFSPLDYLSFYLTDYLNTFYSLESNPLFDFRSSSSPHLLEGGFEINPFTKIPIYFSAYTMFFGPDKKIKIPGDSFSIVNAYSTYIETKWLKEWKDVSLSIFAGITPYKGCYSDKFSIINTGVKLTKIVNLTEKFSVPLQCNLILNPAAGNIYFVTGLSIQ